MNDMLVMNSWFEHKDTHKFIWVCPGRDLKSITCRLFRGKKGYLGEGEICQSGERCRC